MSAFSYQSRRVSDRGRLAERARAIGVEGWILWALVVVAAAIRIATLTNQSFWTDEALTGYETRLPFGAMLHTVTSVETTPPLYFVVIWVWAKLFGGGEVALRSLSAIAGIAVVPIAYLSARELFSRRAGLLTAAFIAVNPMMVWFSQEARAYMLLTALTGASFLWFLRARRDPSRRNLSWWAVLSALALMTHFFAGFGVAPEALWLLWSARSRAGVAAVSVVGAAQLAMLPFAVTAAAPSRGAGWIAASAPVNRIGTAVVEWGASTLYRRVTSGEGIIGGAVLGAIVLALLLFGGDRRSRQGAAVAAVIAATVIAVPLALGALGIDYFLSRNELPAFVPVTTVLAGACVVPRARLPGAALAAALLVLFCFATVDVQTHPYLQRAAWRDVARSLGPATVPRAILASNGTTADPLKIYLPGVTWAQPRGLAVLVREIDVVGTKKRLRVQGASGPATSAVALRDRVDAKQGALPTGSSLPRSVAPAGATLLARFRVDNWIVARFELAQTERISIDGLRSIAHRFFRRTPAALLVFTQRSGR